MRRSQAGEARTMLISASDPRRLWLLVRTKPKQEAKVTQSLHLREIEAYFPKLLEPRLRRRQPRGPVPMFPGYVFAHIVIGERFAGAQYCPGAAGLVRLGECFAAVEDALVDGLRACEGDRGYVVVETPKEIRTGSRVRVVDGALAGIEGIVTRYIPGRRRVQLLLTHAWGGRNAEVQVGSIRCA